MFLKKLRIIIFNVEHGFCAFIRSPNGYGLLYDCGKGKYFSAIEYILRNESITCFNGFPLAQLIVSHPHDDHIEDVEALVSKFMPAIIFRQQYDWEEIKQNSGEDYGSLDVYSDWQSVYSYPITQQPDWGMDVQIGPYLTPTETKNISGNFVNNSSIPLFISYKGWKIAFTGDLEKAGWFELIKRADFRSRLQGTNFFVTSHHGHCSGYCKEIYEVMGKPFVNIVSVHSRDDSVESAYSSPSNAIGIQWNGETGYMLTTRKDGTVSIEITEDGKATYNLNHLPNNLQEEAKSFRIW